MRDDVTFEARLADALGRFADLAPTMDDEAVARQAIEAGEAARRTGWLAWLRRGGLAGGTVGRPRLRVVYLLVVLALLLAAIVIVVVGGALRHDAFPPLGHNGTIAFTLQGNNHEAAAAHLMNSDGTGDHPIEAGRCPTYSKDGSVLASLSYEASVYLVALGPDGSPAHKVLLAEEASTSVSYALSPDGTRVAWFKPTAAGSTELWVGAVAGGPGTRIVPASSVPDEFYDSPLWSPDGGQIAFGSYVADADTGERHRTAIYVVGADGSDLHALTSRPGLLEDLMSWSLDGRYLAYLGLPDGLPVPTSAAGDAPSAYPPRDVFLIVVDGTGDRNLTNSAAFESQPEWSPEGAVLAFETSADGEAHRLTTVRMNGPTPVGTPILGPESESFVWSPDGTELLWLEVSTLSDESYRTTLHSIDPEFRQSSTALQTVDGLIVCTPSWQRLGP